MDYKLENLQQEYAKGKRFSYIFFWGHQQAQDGMLTKSCFSQWWPCEFEVEGQIYNSGEQFMMAEKAKLFQDLEIRDKILVCKQPKEIKALGRMIQGFKEEVWQENRFEIVKKGNLAKFSQNLELLNFLVGTKDKVIVEASPFDTIWGIGLAADTRHIEDPFSWKGQNLLGVVLMSVREVLRRQKS